jgi:hypothetical protein
MSERGEGYKLPKEQQLTPTEASKTWKDRVKAGVLGLLDTSVGMAMIHQGLITGDIPTAVLDVAAGAAVGFQGKEEWDEAREGLPKAMMGLDVQQSNKKTNQSRSKTQQETPTQGPPTLGERIEAVGYFLARGYTSEQFATAMIMYATHGDWKPAVASALLTGYMGVRGLMQGSRAIK